jgi:protein-disulfide isomerase
MEHKTFLLGDQEQGHRRGVGDAAITLVEYGDFESAACGSLYPILHKVLERFTPSVHFVFKHFPLTHLHAQAMGAAQAAEAAAEQNRFWEMHDLLFQNQAHLGVGDLHRHATKLRLDLKKFNTDFNDRAVLARIERDIRQGAENGVHQTPTLFIDNGRYDGPLEESHLSSAIKRAADAHRKAAAKGFFR